MGLRAREWLATHKELGKLWEGPKRIEEILNKPHLEEKDIAILIMHYIDDYTVNSQWASPAVVDSSGFWKNDLDRRMDGNDTNEKYEKIAAASFYKEQRRVGGLAEHRIARLLNEKGVELDEKKIPEFIDLRIKAKIEKI